jgi:preprotein translocase subunit SecE
MAVEVATAPKGAPGKLAAFVRGIVPFYREVVAEMKKVTWPDVPQVRQLSVGVILLSLFIGLLIFVLDWLLSVILVNGFTRLFGG